MALWLNDLQGMKQYRNALFAPSCRRLAPAARADQAAARPERRPASAVTFGRSGRARWAAACPARTWADGDEPATVAPPSPAQPPGATPHPLPVRGLRGGHRRGARASLRRLPRGEGDLSLGVSVALTLRPDGGFRVEELAGVASRKGDTRHARARSPSPPREAMSVERASRSCAASPACSTVFRVGQRNRPARRSRGSRSGGPIDGFLRRRRWAIEERLGERVAARDPRGLATNSRGRTVAIGQNRHAGDWR